jgi:hypothetical protein
MPWLPACGRRLDSIGRDVARHQRQSLAPLGQSGRDEHGDGVITQGCVAGAKTGAPATFVPLPLPATNARAKIRIELRRGGTTISMT